MSEKAPGRRSWLSVGEVSRRSGQSVASLHFYERRGLISCERSSGNQRRYRREVLRRLAFIRAAQEVGFSLREVTEALATLPDGRTPNKADWARLSRQWQETLDRRIRALQALRDQLTQCIGCGCLSLRACGLYNAEDRLGEQGPGARRLQFSPD